MTNSDWALVLVCDARYALPTAVCLRSVSDNLANPPKMIHILGENISPSDRELIGRQIRGIPVDFRTVTSPLLSFAAHADAAHVSSAMFLKCLAPQVVDDSVEKLIYLDSDTLVRADLSELAHLDLGGHTAGLVPDRYVSENVIDPGEHAYFNSGVMLVDSGRWNEAMVTESLLAEAAKLADNLRFPDQDVLNKILRGSIRPLDKRWNYMVGETVKNDPRGTAGADAAVIHYCGPTKPWNVTLPNALLQAEYDKYLAAVRSDGEN